MKKNSRGVSMIQFAIILPLFMVIIAIIIDFGRFYMVKNVLAFAAFQGASTAKSISNFDFTFKGEPATNPWYLRFAEARRHILEVATRIPLESSLIGAADSDDNIRLLRYDYEDPVAVPANTPLPTFSASAAVVRPFERAARIQNGQVTYIENPDAPYDSQNAINQESAIYSYPIMVEVSAELNLLLPFFKPVVVTGRSFSFRERIPRGPFDQETEERLGTWDEYLASRVTTTTLIQTVTTTSSTPTSTICKADWGHCNQSFQFNGRPPGVTVLCPNPLSKDANSVNCNCDVCSEVIQDTMNAQ